MICPKCGTETRDGPAFCSSCGARLTGSSVKASKPASKKRIRVIAGILVVFVAVALVIAFWPRSDQDAHWLSYAEVVTMVTDNQVSAVVIVDSKTLLVTEHYTPPSNVTVHTYGTVYGVAPALKARIDPAVVDSFTQLALEHGVDVSWSRSAKFNWIWVVVGAGAVLLGGFVGYFIGRRRASQ
ncbi:MAG: zinc ribbon domain-containing protein [Dehalococcoidia bacterium]|nr:zinc ribbon domain-containing protein [Dehalococcoidia bacterium]